MPALALVDDPGIELAANTAKAADIAVLAGDIEGDVASGGDANGLGETSVLSTSKASSVAVYVANGGESGGIVGRCSDAGPTAGSMDVRATGVAVDGGVETACVEAARKSAATSCAVDRMAGAS